MAWRGQGSVFSPELAGEEGGGGCVKSVIRNLGNIK